MIALLSRASCPVSDWTGTVSQKAEELSHAEAVQYGVSSTVTLGVCTWNCRLSTSIDCHGRRRAALLYKTVADDWHCGYSVPCRQVAMSRCCKGKRRDGSQHDQVRETMSFPTGPWHDRKRSCTGGWHFLTFGARRGT